jgi:hypothetical protein
MKRPVIACFKLTSPLILCNVEGLDESRALRLSLASSYQSPDTLHREVVG